MTTTGRTRPGQPPATRRALAIVLLAGAVGAGLAFAATRQGWAQVRTTPPHPLPPSVVGVTGAALVPYATALMVAGLASLAAVLATRQAWRRLSGVILALLGAGLAASVFTVSAAGAVAAAAAAVGPASNPGAGSVTQGSAGAHTVPDVVGATPHVVFTAVGWQVMVVTGALLLIAVGLFVSWRPDRLAVMSSKYDAPGRARRGVQPGRQQSAAGQQAAVQPADSAAMWEALSRGDDPTASGRQTAGA